MLGTLEAVGQPEQLDGEHRSSPRSSSSKLPESPRIGLVLGGGGIAGYAFHAGVLAALDELTGFDPRNAEIIVGTSAGSIAAAALRGGVTSIALRSRLLNATVDPEEKARIRVLSGRSLQAIPRVWAGPGSLPLAVDEIRRGPRQMRLTRLVAGLLPPGRLSLDTVAGPLLQLHGDRWPDRTMWLTATEWRTGELVVFGRDRFTSVDQAVSASCALPGFFTPTEIDDERLIDGGIDSTFNIDLLTGYRSEGRPLDLVIVAAPMSLDRSYRSIPLSSLARVPHRLRLKRELERFASEQVPTLVLQPDRKVAGAMGLNPMDHSRIDRIVSSVDDLVADRLADTDPELQAVLDRAGRLERQPEVPYPKSVTAAEP